MRIKLRRHLAILLCVILLLALAPSGFAVDLTPGANTVTVNLVPTGSVYAEDLASVRILADIYLLARAEQYGSSDSYKYTLPDNDDLYSIVDKLNKDLDDDDKPEAPPEEVSVFQRFAPYAQEFAAIVLDKDYSDGPTKSELVVAEKTTATIRYLDPGLYLLVIHGANLTTKDDDPETGYVKTTTQTSTEEGAEAQSVLTTRVETKSNEYLFQPQLLTVPTKLSDKNEQLYNTAYGEWVNALTIFAKPTQVPKNGDLKIVKNLSHPGPDPVTFVFQVAWPKGNPTTTKVVSMTFASGQAYEEYTLAGVIPVGTEVEVTEVHSGIGYTASVSTQSAKIKVNPPATEDGASAEDGGIATVRFDNDHSGPGGGHGLLNRFTATEADFVWTGDQGYSDSNAADEATVPAAASDS